MRNALGLMLASVVTAVIISAVWFFWSSSSPRLALAAPNTIAAPLAKQRAQRRPIHNSLHLIQDAASRCPNQAIRQAHLTDIALNHGSPR